MSSRRDEGRASRGGPARGRGGAAARLKPDVLPQAIGYTAGLPVSEQASANRGGAAGHVGGGRQSSSRGEFRRRIVRKIDPTRVRRGAPLPIG